MKPGYYWIRTKAYGTWEVALRLVDTPYRKGAQGRWIIIDSDEAFYAKDFLEIGSLIEPPTS